MGMKQGRTLNTAFLPGAPVAPSNAADLTNLENRVGALETGLASAVSDIAALTVRVASLEANMPAANRLIPPGGAAGTQLTKTAALDYAVGWDVATTAISEDTPIEETPRRKPRAR